MIVKMKRTALHALEPNMLPPPRSLPRLSLDNAMRQRKFGSTSKTPKISNCADVNDDIGRITKRRGRRTKRSSSRHESSRRRRHSSQRVEQSLDAVRDPPRITNPSALLPGSSSHEQQPSHPKPEDDEDMDISSGGSVELSSVSTPEGSPQTTASIHYRPTPAAAAKNRGNEDRAAVEIMSTQALSPKMAKNHRSFAMVRQIPCNSEDDNAPPPSAAVLEDFLRHVQHAPADDPDVLSKVLHRGTTMVGAEIGGDGLQQEEFLAESDITVSTLGSRVTVGMPSFSPKPETTNRQGAVRPQVASRDVAAEQKDDDADDDIVEEWSLPDEEVQGEIEFVLQGKKYIHKPLPPGWRMEISKSHNRPFYVHPDNGSTWHCPVELPPTSKAKRIRRSSTETRNDQVNHQDKKPAAIPSRERMTEDSSANDTMSDIVSQCIHGRNAPKQGGYDASESSDAWSQSTESNTESMTSRQRGSVQDGTINVAPSAVPQGEHSDWETPLRSGITTPSIPKRPRTASGKKAAVPQLSPIAEHIAAQRLFGSDRRREESASSHPAGNGLGGSPLDAQTRSKQQRVESASGRSQGGTRSEEGEKRSTPRVSFDYMEVANQAAFLIPQGNPSAEPGNPGSRLHKEGKRPAAAQQSPSPSKKGSVEASTPISDTEGSDEEVATHRPAQRNNIVEVGSSRHASRTRRDETPVRSTPSEIPALASELRHAPMKRQSMHSASLLRNAPLGTPPPPSTDTIEDAPRSHSGPATASLPPRAPRITHSNGRETTSNTPPPRALQHRNGPASTDASLVRPSAPQKGTTKPDIPMRHVPPLATDTGSFSDERSPLREDRPSTPIKETATRAEQSPSSASGDDFGAMIADSGYDDESSAEEKGPIEGFRPERAQRNSSPVSQGFLSQQSYGRYSLKSQSTIPSKISFKMTDDSSPEGSDIEAQPVDDDISEALASPPLPKRNSCKYNWRVLYPFHPFCSLQRIDALLEEQRKKCKRKAAPKKAAKAQPKSKAKNKQNAARVYKSGRTPQRSRTRVN